jgi:hypothetical protein
MIQNKWKEFAIRQVLSDWSKKVDPATLYDWIEQTEDKDLEQLLLDYEVIIFKQFENLSLYDVACQISELATLAQGIQDQDKPLVVSKPEIISVTLSNGDVALFVNSDAVLQLDAQDAGQNPAEIGKYLAKALGVELQEINMDVPTDEEWCWNDVYELLPPTELAEANDTPIIWVEMDNGRVNNVVADRPCRVVVTEEDLEGADDDSILIDNNGNELFLYKSQTEAEVNPERVAELFDKAQKAMTA